MNTHVASCTREEALYLFLDGELPLSEQPALFAHLSDCADCRAVFNGLMAFRRLSREETIAVPPAVDDAFFQKLDAHKRVTGHVDRAAQRRPLWQSRASISVRSAAVVAAIVFVFGLLVPIHTPEAPPPLPILVEEERVTFIQDLPPLPDPILVIYPGLTIEAYRDLSVEPM